LNDEWAKIFRPSNQLTAMDPVFFLLDIPRRQLALRVSSLGTKAMFRCTGQPIVQPILAAFKAAAAFQILAVDDLSD
jgi:hypothetical protein